MLLEVDTVAGAEVGPKLASYLWAALYWRKREGQLRASAARERATELLSNRVVCGGVRLIFVTCLVISCSKPKLSVEQDEPIDRETLEMQQEKEDALNHMAALSSKDQPPVIGNCYSGFTPKGRHAIDELVRMKRVDLMRKLLIAPSPDGRAYAAIGLYKAGAISKEELDANLASILKPIHVCQGCLVDYVPATEALSYYTECGFAGW